MERQNSELDIETDRSYVLATLSATLSTGFFFYKKIDIAVARPFNFLQLGLGLNHVDK